MTQQGINNASMLKVGTILHGTYRIDSYLSSGGFGNTYVATNIEFEERVAIKEFFMKGVTQRDDNQTTVSVSNSENTNSFLGQKEKFKKEARRLRKINNEHLVKVYDLFDENGTTYYVMDYVDGENLSEWLKRNGRSMTESEVRLILPQILDALKAVHNEGFCHLDIKPSNIMLEKGGKIKLIDFGASKQLGANGTLTTNAPTAFAQTPGYAPREQMEQNHDKIGPWTDIYALGATLYNLLTNKRPPLPTDIDDDISEDKHVALPFPESVGEMKYLVLQMMKTNRLQRPQSVGAIIRHQEQVKKDIQKVLSADATQSIDDEKTIISEPHICGTVAKKDKVTLQDESLSRGIKKKKRRRKMITIFTTSFILLCLILFGYNSYKDYCINKIRISEVLTNNTANIVDDFGARTAWIELENNFLFPCNIGGLYLTSDRSCLDPAMSNASRVKRMSLIQENLLGASNQVLFFCNSSPAQGKNYLSLKIPMSEPVWIALYDKTASHIIDSVTIPALAADQSYRRINNMWVVTPPYNVTPGTTNIE